MCYIVLYSVPVTNVTGCDSRFLSNKGLCLTNLQFSRTGRGRERVVSRFKLSDVTVSIIPRFRQGTAG